MSQAIFRTTDEWNQLFPIMEIEMTQDHLKIRLADEQISLNTTLPKEFMDGLLTKWQAFQRGETTEVVAWSRHYTGAWNKE